MRLDKFLKISRIIKRRSVAKEIIEKNRIKVNDKKAKPSTEVTVDDIIDIEFGNSTVKIKVLKIDEKASKEQAVNLYEVLNREEI